MINHKLNGDFESHLIFGVTRGISSITPDFYESIIAYEHLVFTLTDLYRSFSFTILFSVHLHSNFV
jgi:hypothetical protein